MGESKQKQYNRKPFLQMHSRCVYCGVVATTTDHCPPRCFFHKRIWPETFEYPACSPCNSAARLDEQALALMIRSRIRPSVSAQVIDSELAKLGDGVANNQPHLVEEWYGMHSATGEKKTFREMFGKQDGDRLRLDGWTAMKIGPLTRNIISRFMIRLGQTMFYNNIGEIFQGDIYTRHVSLFQIPDPDSYLRVALSIAPIVGLAQRSGKNLQEQFAYQYNFSKEDRAFYALVSFSEQFVFQITALGPSMAARFAARGHPSGGVGEKTTIIF